MTHRTYPEERRRGTGVFILCMIRNVIVGLFVGVLLFVFIFLIVGRKQAEHDMQVTTCSEVPVDMQDDLC